MFDYTVRCTFRGENRHAVSKDWLAWLEHGHIQDVIDGGALGAYVVELDSPKEETILEVRYRFENRDAFQKYESDHAPRLREEGREKFPHELGLSYERTTGVERLRVKL